jgi:ubiquinone/menaquinone biosynthesis C-methylase UbiE
MLKIGVGGGRIANQIAPHVAKLYATDIAPHMIERSRAALSSHKNIEFFTLPNSSLALFDDASCDFIYSFDVFVHLDLHTMWRYFQEIHRILKPGGHAFLHTTNLASPQGWKRFAAQKSFKVEGHYFITPEIISVLCKKSNLQIVHESPIDESNFYYARDYLFVVLK